MWQGKTKEGVGQQSLLPQVQLTDPVYWLRAGKTVDIIRCASESTDLLPPYALPRPHSRPAAYPPARPAAGQLAAAAAHCAAVVEYALFADFLVVAEYFVADSLCLLDVNLDGSIIHKLPLFVDELFKSNLLTVDIS